MWNPFRREKSAVERLVDELLASTRLGHPWERTKGYDWATVFNGYALILREHSNELDRRLGPERASKIAEWSRPLSEIARLCRQREREAEALRREREAEAILKGGK
jgi:hypothetical protein